jgi:hypothetical protein
MTEDWQASAFEANDPVTFREESGSRKTTAMILEWVWTRLPLFTALTSL